MRMKDIDIGVVQIRRGERVFLSLLLLFSSFFYSNQTKKQESIPPPVFSRPAKPRFLVVTLNFSAWRTPSYSQYFAHVMIK